MEVYTKDPEAVLDYGFDWGTSWLASGETLIASAWTVPAGLTKDSSAFTTAIALVWLSGGTLGEVYIVTNHITTSDGREEDRSHVIMIKDR
jgi:hypothetical protein